VRAIILGLAAKDRDFFVSLFSPAQDLLIMPATRVRVFANAAWQDTGISVPASHVVKIKQVDMKEHWCTNPDKGPTDANGFAPDGIAQEGSLVVGVPFGGLVATIFPTNSTAWVGADGSIAAPAAGKLKLGANDDDHHDNHGSIDFDVTVL